VALDLEITDELRAEGIAREVIRSIQDLRKARGLAVQDRISLSLTSDDPVVTEALKLHGDLIAREVLATDVHANVSGDMEEVALDEGLVLVGLTRT
jgi:isoleucyl-tRNA synthetase